MASIKILVEKRSDGYAAYPLDVKSAVVGQGDTYEAALDDVRSAIAFRIEASGADFVSADSPVLEAFVAAATVVG